jgi:hypothetical protein
MNYLNKPQFEVDYVESEQELIELVQELGFRVPAWLDRSKTWVNAANDPSWDTFCQRLWRDIKQGHFEFQGEFKNFPGRRSHTRVEYILKGNNWQLESYWGGQEVTNFTLTRAEK